MDQELSLYTKVYAGLLVLTLLSVGFFNLHLAREMAIAAALGIASVKGFLIAWHFMHLKNDRPLILGIVVTGIVAVAILAFGEFADLSWRLW
jgi:caa(3)-type oxidase subunit IV